MSTSASLFHNPDLWPTRPSPVAGHAQAVAPSTVSHAPDRVVIDASNEGTVIAALDRLGYLYYNSFDSEPDGGATIRAIYRSTGELRTLHIEPSGTIGVESGWKQ